MDNLLGKVGIYDFMGVWGAGAVTTCYSLLTFIHVKSINIIGIMQQFNADYSLLIIFFFCVVSYIIGTFLHEIGKRICELFPGMFEIQRIKEIEPKGKTLLKEINRQKKRTLLKRMKGPNRYGNFSSLFFARSNIEDANCMSK